MKAVILVGGEGTRLRPLTHKIPKQMIRIAGTTMIERVLRNLKNSGIYEAVLSLGYKPDAFLKAFPESRAQGVSLTYVVEDSPLDTAGAIRYAATNAGIKETFVVLNGDVLTDLNLSEVIKFHESSKARGTIALTPVEDPSRFGVVPTTEDGKVINFIEKPRAEDAPTNYINAGTYVFEPEVIGMIDDGRRVSIERETFPEMVKEGSLFAYKSDDYWLDTGTHESLLKASFDVLTVRKDRFVENATEASPTIFLGKGVSVSSSSVLLKEILVLANSEIEDNVKLDKAIVHENSIVGMDCVIRNSILYENVRVGKKSTVVNSIVADDVEIGDEAVLENTVIGRGERIEAGSRLSGARIPS